MYWNEKESIIQIISVSFQTHTCFAPYSPHIQVSDGIFIFPMFLVSEKDSFRIMYTLQYDCTRIHWEFHVSRVELRPNGKPRSLDSSIVPLLNSLPRGFESLGVGVKVLITAWFCLEQGPWMWTLRITLRGSSVFQEKCFLAREFYLLLTHTFIVLPAVLLSSLNTCREWVD